MAWPARLANSPWPGHCSLEHGQAQRRRERPLSGRLARRGERHARPWLPAQGQRRTPWIYGRIDIRPDDVVIIDGEQPIYQPPPQGDIPNLEADLVRDGAFLAAIKDDRFALSVRTVFDNRSFYKGQDPRSWVSGERSAAALVANLRDRGESYHDYYPGFAGLRGTYPDDRPDIERRLRHASTRFRSRSQPRSVCRWKSCLPGLVPASIRPRRCGRQWPPCSPGLKGDGRLRTRRAASSSGPRLKRHSAILRAFARTTPTKTSSKRCGLTSVGWAGARKPSRIAGARTGNGSSGRCSYCTK
jgi:hypothetical protein